MSIYSLLRNFRFIASAFTLVVFALATNYSSAQQTPQQQQNTQQPAQAQQSTAPATAPEPPAPQTFGAWTKTCTLVPGSPTPLCEIIQSVRAADRPDIFYRVSIFRGADDQGVLLRVIVPIRVELPLGVGVNIDGNDMGNMPYRRCLGQNCVAEAFITNEILSAFRSGSQATFFIFPTPEQGIGGIVSLDGFTAAYDSLAQ